MISIVLTNRNRDLRIVKKCIDSLISQSDSEFDLYLVDYGSSQEYLEQLKIILNNYLKIKLVFCPVSGQLWNKSRAINIVLKKINSGFFFVGDIDMIYHPDFVKKIKKLGKKEEAVYFKVGFLSEDESQLDKKFEDYTISFLSSKEATGMTLYPTEMLKGINGYDEFFHGWGAEDTDVHLRINATGKLVHFFDEEILMLHQWHPKVYRSKNSNEPFHSKLETINHRYIKLSVQNKIAKANTRFDFGILPEIETYEYLKKSNSVIEINNEKNEIDAFLNGVIYNLTVGEVYEVRFSLHPLYSSLKNKLKLFLGKKALEFYSLEHVNNMILMKIIADFRNVPYDFVFHKDNDTIILKIKL